MQVDGARETKDGIDVVPVVQTRELLLEDEKENAELAGVLRQFETGGVHFHALRTRQAGHQRFAEVHVLVPGEWSVRRGHDLIEELEAQSKQAAERATNDTIDASGQASESK